MSAQANTQHGEATLVEKITHPAFFEKVASAGRSPQSPDEAESLFKLAHVVGLSVGTSVNRVLTHKTVQAASAVKAAADAAAMVAGTIAQQPTETPAASYLQDEAIKAAAVAYIAEQVKAAGLADVIPGMGSSCPPKAMTPEEEEEKKKKTV